MRLPRIVLIAGLLGVLGLPYARFIVAQTAATDRPPARIPTKVPQQRDEREPAGPRSLIGKAIRSLDATRTLSAHTRVRANIFERPLIGSGSYWERKGPRGVEYRWEMKFQIGDDTANFVQVCNGRYLWIAREMGKKGSLDRVDVERVLEALGNDPQSLPASASCGSWLLLGGLGKLLASLDHAFEFESVEETILERDLPVLRLEGTWKPAVLTGLLAEPHGVIQSGKIVKPEKMPPHLPHILSVYLEKGELCPRRIEYVRKRSTGDLGKATTEYLSMATIDFVDIAMNDSIPDSVRFTLDAAVQEIDKTDQFLENLGLKKRGPRYASAPDAVRKDRSPNE
jgi:hypothetical protein